jgi:hypothetical protein
VIPPLPLCLKASVRGPRLLIAWGVQG